MCVYSTHRDQRFQVFLQLQFEAAVSCLTLVLGTDLDPLQKQYMVSITELSLQPPLAKCLVWAEYHYVSILV